MSVKHIRAKTILSEFKEDPYFGIRYNMNLYRGCQHGCIYCDSRSSCYRMDALENIYVKDNAIQLLAKELSKKRSKGTIGFGSMNDPYMPLEKSLLQTQNALKIVESYRFPIHILTKSNLVLRDLDLIKRIGKVYAAITFTVTTPHDALSKIIEPHAPTSSERLEAMQVLSKNGIYTGIAMMPILPFINDDEKSIMELTAKAAEMGAKYVLPCFGVTMRDGSREYFYQQLDVHFPSLSKKYHEAFRLKYQCNSPNAKRLYEKFYSYCRNIGMPARMDFYRPENVQQLKLF